MIMDNQKIQQMLNEQSLVNMSIIEQLSKQAEYLNSIVERLEIIYGAMQEGYAKNINTNHNKTTNIKQTQSHDTNELNLKDVKVDTSNIKSSNTQSKVTKSKGIENKDVKISISEDDQIETITSEINDYIYFGDRIKVITKTCEQTGVFIELNHQYLVWVIDEGRLTFTDIVGATIIKLS